MAARPPQPKPPRIASPGYRGTRNRYDLSRRGPGLPMQSAKEQSSEGCDSSIALLAVQIALPPTVRTMSGGSRPCLQLSKANHLRHIARGMAMECARRWLMRHQVLPAHAE